ncbi:MAG: hypothetical protein IJI65_02690 [Lachnospiraceae bacterium]|nr:hypothetical protein [Lachnospiraceae bacterium]
MFPLFKKQYIISFLLCGLILFLCYLLSGVLGEVLNDGVPVGNALISVLSTPFSDHFNDFTPILLLLGFVVFEFFWFYFKFRPGFLGRKKTEDENLKEDSKGVEKVETVKKEKAASPIHDSRVVQEDMAVGSDDADNESSAKNIDITKFGFVIPDDVKEISSPDNETDKALSEQDSSGEDESQIEEISDDIISLSSDIVWDLNGDYSMDQIKEMIQLKRYMKYLDAETLRKTFKPSLSAEDIREYIELFYG